MAASGNQSPGETLHVRIISPELDFQSLIVFNSEDTVWTAKQKIISTLCKDLKDCLNYGLYCPSINNRAGKFLDEERLLKDYPLPGPIGLLEFKYKRRLYKMQVNPAKLKKLHSTSNLKKFMEIVYKGDADKVTELVNRGLDPNFYESGKGEGGETPLTAAASLSRPRSVMLALVGGGAYLDFRNRRGATALHVGAELGNRDAIKTLLDLGASPNYKDARGLTALFDCVAVDRASAQCVQMLLHDRAEICNRDGNGWTEIHHCCLHGRVQHLEHLLFYGADMNAKTATGDTALHVCARYNQEECARALMFRGADRTAKNADNETAEQTARSAGHTKLAETIGKFRPEDVVLYSELPNYNEKRRGTISVATIRNLQRSRSNPHLHQLFASDSNFTASLSSAGGYQVLTNHGFLFRNNQSSGSATNSANSQSNREQPATRTVLLQRDDTGFGFVLRGAKSRTGADEKLVFTPSPECPALQYFDKVEAGSPSERAGLLSGDFLIEVNGENVTSASHDYTVSLIKNSRNQVTLKVVTPADRNPRRESAVPTQVNNTSAKFSNPPSLSPSTGSQTRAKLAGLAELERLDATLDQYENEGHRSPSGTFKEPEPDYEDDAPPPPPPSRIPPPTANECKAAAASATADEYGNDEAESSSGGPHPSAFAVMIKQATLNRERRTKERGGEESRISIQDDGFQSSPGSACRPAMVVVESFPPSVPTPPPPPPPPPPPIPVPSAGVPQRPGAGGRGAMPSEVRKTLDENRKRDEAHAAIMAAVLKRRTLLEAVPGVAEGDGAQSAIGAGSSSSENSILQQNPRKIQVVYGSGDRVNGSSVQSGVTAFKVNGSAEERSNGGGSLDSVGRRFQAPPNRVETTAGTAASPGSGGGNTSWRPVTQDRSSAVATVANGRGATSHRNNSVAQSSLSHHGNGGDAVSRPSTLSRISSPSAAAAGSSSQPNHPRQQNQSHSLLDLSRLPEGVVGVTAPFLPPPAEFSGPDERRGEEKNQGDYDAVPVSATLRNVAKNPVGNSTKFPARVQPDNSAGNSSNRPNNGIELVGCFARRAIDAWSVDDVTEFLDSLDYGAYGERFAQMKVDGKRLAEVKDPDLVTLGVENVLHRIKLSREIRRHLQGNRLPA